MPDIDAFKKKEHDNFDVMLPCKQSDFGEFISGLLGKPQTIEKSYEGAFEVTKDDITNTFEQRIDQQNDATLIQFTVKILYNDKSSVLLNSIQDFQVYNEVRPLKSIGVSLSWTYLIKFKNKNVPEKQEINISFDSYGNTIYDNEIMLYPFRRSVINSRIHHTERTWGIDIESLLNGHISSLTTIPNKFEQFIYKNHGWIGFFGGFFFFISLIFATLKIYNQLTIDYIEKVNLIANETTNEIELLLVKVNSIFDFTFGTSEVNISFSLALFIFGAFMASIILGNWLSEKSNNRPQSFVLLSKLAEENRIKVKNKIRTNWILFGVSIITSIITSIIASVLFKIYIEQTLA
jgi:hypothetical protein